MIYLALAVTCSLGIAMVFKYTGRRGIETVYLITVNYAAAVLCGVMFGDFNVAWLPTGLVVLTLSTGALFISAFWVFARATELAGMSLAVAVMRISVCIPFVVSVVLWDERPSAWQIFGLFVAVVAFVLVQRPGSHSRDSTMSKSGGLILLVLFLMGGTIDVLLKVFDTYHADVLTKETFALGVFATAGMLGAGWSVIRFRGGVRDPLGASILWGAILGVINYGSLVFMLGAVSALPGTFVFPANAIAIVVGGAILGVGFWQESLTRANWIGIALCVVAVAFLSV